MTAPTPPDWQLPTGVNRGLWDYLHDAGIARRYDSGLAGSALFEADVAFVLEHCRTPGFFLDMGCGTGRLLIPLARMGWQAVGVDLSAEMLAVAHARLREAGVRAGLLRANLAELSTIADGSFDHAACLFSTLGMVVGRDARRQVVEHAFRILRPGGRFILHVHNRWWHLRTREGRRWLLADQTRTWLGRSDAGDRVMPPHQGIGRLTIHLFTLGEAVRLLRNVGFRIVEVRPVGPGPKARLVWPRLLGGWRAYGFLLAAERM